MQEGLHAEALRFISIPIKHPIEVTIDNFRIGREYHPLKVKAPSPEAYIFHKGLIDFLTAERQTKEGKGPLLHF